MSANPIDKNSTPKTTGSLEELFRHHLGEEAAVPPPAQLWDQIDNTLLVRQNETYRRRLVATRWVAAASLLLATLAGTGWWSLRDARFGSPQVATATRASSYGNATAARNGRNAGNSPDDANPGMTPGTEVSVSSRKQASPVDAASAALAFQEVPRNASSHSPTRSQATHKPSFATSNSEQSAFSQETSGSPATAVAPDGRNPVLASNTFSGHAQAVPAGAASAAENTEAESLATMANPATSPDAAAAAALAASSTAGAAPTSAEQVGMLAAHPAALSIAAAPGLPGGLASVSVPADASPALVPRWQYGASYTAGVFNPNVNFSRAGIEHEFDYNPALGAGSPSLTETAAAQYRENLRPGLSQRIALLASRHLAGHWHLNTGAEFSQARAQSASASAFVGEQLLDLGQSANGPLRTTDFRYSMASLPLELRYANPAKRGWSLYGRLGGVVTALLGVRSEVEGSPEATRTYSIMSAGSPYRRVLGSLRGAAGAQYRPAAGTWALTLGPVAEVGLTPLNAHPAQSYFAQSHPYGFGLEAGVEFGR